MPILRSKHHITGFQAGKLRKNPQPEGRCQRGIGYTLFHPAKEGQGFGFAERLQGLGLGAVFRTHRDEDLGYGFGIRGFQNTYLILLPHE
jgi:hypothetical protein